MNASSNCDVPKRSLNPTITEANIMKDEQEITIKFSGPGMSPMTTKCEPERVSRELQLQSRTYTEAEITCGAEKFYLQRFVDSEQWLDRRLFQALAPNMPDISEPV